METLEQRELDLETPTLEIGGARLVKDLAGSADRSRSIPSARLGLGWSAGGRAEPASQPALESEKLEAECLRWDFLAWSFDATFVCEADTGWVSRVAGTGQP
jgi:hypothetical protein